MCYHLHMMYSILSITTDKYLLEDRRQHRKFTVVQMQRNKVNQKHT